MFKETVLDISSEGQSALTSATQNLTPVAFVFEAGDRSKRPHSAVFVEPNNQRLVCIPIGQANTLACGLARFIISPTPALTAKPAFGVNLQPDTEISQLGDVVPSNLSGWLEGLSEKWGRPRPHSAPASMTRDPS